MRRCRCDGPGEVNNLGKRAANVNCDVRYVLNVVRQVDVAAIARGGGIVGLVLLDNPRVARVDENVDWRSRRRLKYVGACRHRTGIANNVQPMVVALLKVTRTGRGRVQPELMWRRCRCLRIPAVIVFVSNSAAAHDPFAII